MSDTAAVLNRIEAAVKLCYPDDMTPNAKRTFQSIIEAERQRLAAPIPTDWKEAGDQFCKTLVERGAGMEQVGLMMEGAGAFGSFLEMTGWKLVPPNEETN